MKLTNDSNYPVTVKGVRIESGETEEVEIEDVEKYEDDRRFLLEEDDKQPESKDEESSEDDEVSDDGAETSKSKEQKDNKGD